MEKTKYFIFLDNSGSMYTYYNNVKKNLYQIMLNLPINPTILAFGDLTKELVGSSFKEKLSNYHIGSSCTFMKGVVDQFTNYLIDAPSGKKICILFITDGEVNDLAKITPLLLACVDIIISKKLSVYVSCAAIDSSADMKTFSLLGLLNNFSVFQLIQSKDGDNWCKQVVSRFKEIETCETAVYASAPLVRGATSSFVYSDIVVDSRVSERGPYNHVYLAALVQAFTICGFGSEDKGGGFMMCKRLLKHIADLGINAKTRYVWSKLNTAKMVSDKTSSVIANELVSTINDSTCALPAEPPPPGTTLDSSPESNQDHCVSITNEHNVRIRLFVGKTKSFARSLPIAINHQNQITVQSEGLNELYLNIEVYHPTEPVDLEISYGNFKHSWYVPYGVSLIEGDTKYLMLAHEKLNSTNNNGEKMFDFVIKAVPQQHPQQHPKPVLLNEIRNYWDEEDDVEIGLDDIQEEGLTNDDECLRASPPKSLFAKAFAKMFSTTEPAKAFVTTSKEARKIDTIKREYQFPQNAHVLCFSFVFVYDAESFESERLTTTQIIYLTKECVVCLAADSTVKLACNHQCLCSSCYINRPRYGRKCPLCRAPMD